MGIFTAKQKDGKTGGAQAVQPANQAVAVQPTQQPATAGPVVRMADHAPYAIACARLDQVRAELETATAEAARLAGELALSSAPAAVDPVRREALLILGEGDVKAMDWTAKTDRYKALQHRIAVLRVAEAEGENFLRRHDRAAVRGVLESAAPAYKALLVNQVKAMVGAALASAAVVDYVDSVSAEVAPANSSGIGDYSLRVLGDPRDPNSRISIWIAELVNMGFIDGREDYLAGVAFVARRPDGTAIDTTPKATPIKPPSPSPLSSRGRTAPTPRPTQATAPTEDAPEFPSFTPARPAHEGDGPTASIRMLSDLHYPDRVYRAGETVDWHANGARVLVRKGRAEYVVKPAAAAVVAPVAVAPAGTATGA